MIRLFTIAAAGVALASQAMAAPPPPTPADIATFMEGGAYVFRTDQTNYPLYTFDRDEPSKSNCTGRCAAAWPPVLVDEGSAVGDWTTLQRDDGKMQWVWRGQPVYWFANDEPSKPTGDGMGGVWRLLPTIPAG